MPTNGARRARQPAAQTARKHPADEIRDEHEEEYDRYDDEYEDEEDEYDDGEDQPDLSPTEAAQAAAGYITALTGKELGGVVSLERGEDGWLVGVEVVEDRRIPSSNDMLGLYLAKIDLDGSLLTYQRTKRYARGRGESAGVT